jgi:hypothetical protein
MTDLDVRDPAAKTDDTVNPAFLAASMTEERAQSNKRVSLDNAAAEGRNRTFREGCLSSSRR